MARGVGDDEFPSRSGEVTIRNVDGDSLLALGAQTIRQKREINRSARAVNPALFHGSQLVFVDALGVMQQPSNECGLAVIHAAGSCEAQQFLLLVLRRRRVESLVYQWGRQHQK